MSNRIVNFSIGGVINTISRYFNFFEKQQYLPVFILTICIQGEVIACQFLAAFILAPSEIGVIRSLEAALSLIVMIGGCGAQALAIRDVARQQCLVSQLKTLRDIYLVAVLGSIIMIFCFVFVYYVQHITPIYSFLPLMLGLVFLTNAVRATSGFFQGVQKVDKIYLFQFVITFIAIFIQLTFTHQWRELGWVIGRYLSEALILLAMWAALYKLIGQVPWGSRIDWASLTKLMRDGFAVNVANIIRLLIDNLPIFLLIAFKIPNNQIGFLGLALLANTAATLPMAVASQRILPIMFHHNQEPQIVRKLTKEIIRLNFKLSLVGLFILLSGCLFMYFFIGGHYATTFFIEALLCWVLPFKGFTLAYGTLLMSRASYRVSILLGISEVILIIGIGLLTIVRWGMIGAVFATVIGAIWSAGSHRFAALSALR